MGFMDKLKQKAEQYDLQGKAEKLADGIEKTTQQAVEKAGDLAHENRDRVSAGLDKAGAKFDERTEGKYSDKVAKAKDALNKGVDKVAEQRHTTPSAGATGGPESTPDVATPPAAGPQDVPPPPPASGTTSWPQDSSAT